MLVRPVIKFGPFEFDPAAGLLYQGDEETLLPPKAAGVLHVLLRNPTQLVTKDKLLEEVWAGAYVTESSLTDAISLLRQVLADDSRDPTYIQTLHRRGYRFIAPVVQAISEDGSGGLVEGVEGVTVPSVEPVGEGRAGSAGGWVPGDRLGNYEILDTLGAGAMGTVYRARDESLEREVAIKALPSDFADDPERVGRLEQEAKLLASVSHPNIAAIHSLEEADGIRFPVFELVEGETLEQRLRSGRLPVDEALEIGRQIASALEAAHERGIIHRDLKPANIKITPEGQVKVLDFGLAKALEVKVFGADSSESPTESIAVMGSRRGSIVGTAAYISPEQARGQEIDKRADIWSFGAVLYELLTGRRPFEGETVSDTIAGVLEREPEWNALPPETPALVRSLLRRVLQKDPVNRLHAIADARIEIEEAMAEPLVDAVLPNGTAIGAAPWWRSRRVAWGATGIAVGAIVAGLAVWSLTRPTPAVSPVSLWHIDVEPGQHLWGLNYLERQVFGFQRPSRTAMRFSPDGSYLVYAVTADEASSEEGWFEQGQLYLRWRDQPRARPIAGTGRGGSPFVSPDGEWIAFYARRAEGGYEIKKVAADGGGLRTILAEAPGANGSWGASWGDNGTILFADGEFGGLLQVPDTGGSLPERVTTVDPNRGETSHRLPYLLPGSRAALFTVVRGTSWDRAEIALLSLDDGEYEVLIEDGADARYVPSGHLVFVRRGKLMAAPFDLERLVLTGDPVRVLDDVMQEAYGVGTGQNTGAGQFSISGSGSLAYAQGGMRPEIERPLVWVDREGNPEPLPLPLGEYRHPRASPDGKQLAYAEGRLGDMDIWVHDVQRRTKRRLTLEGHNWSPVWSPDSTRIAFSSNRDGSVQNLYWMAADGSGQERLTRSDRRQEPLSWSPDGVLTFREVGSGNIWVLDVDGDRQPRQFTDTPIREEWPMFSPNGKWIAFASNESGRWEVNVRPYPGPGQPTAVTTEGGYHLVWSRDGREIFYRPIYFGSELEHRRSWMMAVEVSTGQTFTTGTPRKLFEAPFRFIAAAGSRSYDVTSDGRFIMIPETTMEPQPVTRIEIIDNWFEELSRLVPTGH